MSKKGTIVEGMDLVASFMGTLQQYALDWGKIHPYNSLLMMNLMGNVGYVLLEDGKPSFPSYTFFGKVIQGRTFDTKKDALAYCFRIMALHSGEMMDAQKVHNIFGTFNLSKLVSSLTGLLK